MTAKWDICELEGGKIAEKIEDYIVWKMKNLDHIILKAFRVDIVNQNPI